MVENERKNGICFSRLTGPVQSTQNLNGLHGEKGTRKKICQGWDSNPRPHMWTRSLRTCRAGKITLESGALDRSATLTAVDNTANNPYTIQRIPARSHSLVVSDYMWRLYSELPFQYLPFAGTHTLALLAPHTLHSAHPTPASAAL